MYRNKSVWSLFWLFLVGNGLIDIPMICSRNCSRLKPNTKTTLLVLALFAVLSLLIPLDSRGRNVVQESPRTVAFYNVFAGNSLFGPILIDQLRTLEVSGALARLDKLYYVAIGTEASQVERLMTFANNSKFKLLQSLSAGSETVTLGHLWEYCKLNSEDRVLCKDGTTARQDVPLTNPSLCQTFTTRVLTQQYQTTSICAKRLIASS